MPDGLSSEEKKSINYSLNVSRGQIMRQMAQRLLKVINAFNFPPFQMLFFLTARLQKNSTVHRLIIKLN